MPVDPQDLVAMIEHELSTISDDRMLAQIRSLLVTPVCERRLWDYGADGQRFNCWIVLRDPETRTSLAYCNEGFGPSCPWGMVWNLDLSLPASSMGTDSSWHSSFLDVYFESRVPLRLPIWRVFEHDGGGWPGKPVTPEGLWDETWKRVAELLSKTSDKRLGVWHSIR